MGRKRTHVEGFGEEKTNTEFAHVKLWIMPERIQPKRYQIMCNCARKNGFTVGSTYTEAVTHVVTDLETKDQALKCLGDKSDCGAMILGTQWFFDCVREKKVLLETPYLLPLELSDENNSSSHLAPDKRVESGEEAGSTDDTFSLAKFNACVPERKARLDHPNPHLSEPLDFLGEYWEVMGHTLVDENRALAFRRAASAVKCLPFGVQRVQQLEGVKDIGEGHSMKVLREVLEHDTSLEVEEKKKNDKFHSLQAFCQVFGVGPSSARKWYEHIGLRDMKQLKERYTQLNINNELILYGLAFYNDLNTPLLFEEAETVKLLLEGFVQELMPGLRTDLIGGFRRGKKQGHDLDLLFCFPHEEGKEAGFVRKLRDFCRQKGLIVWSRAEKSFDNANLDRVVTHVGESQIVDRLELCMTIFKLPNQPQTFENFITNHENLSGAGQPHSKDPADVFALAESEREWRAIRVDFVSAPQSQWAYALLGWTGNKQYNRALRQYAKVELGLLFSSAGLWDTAQNQAPPAKTEEDIFKYLKLSYRPPEERNF